MRAPYYRAFSLINAYFQSQEVIDLTGSPSRTGAETQTSDTAAEESNAGWASGVRRIMRSHVPRYMDHPPAHINHLPEVPASILRNRSVLNITLYFLVMQLLYSTCVQQK